MLVGNLHVVFIHAALASTNTSCHRVSVCLPFIHLSQVGVLLKWLNIGSCKQCHMIA